VVVNVIGPIANFNTIGILEETTVVEFNNLSTGAVSYTWDLGNETLLNAENPSTTYETSQNYIITLIATNAEGCTDTLVRPIKIKPEFYFYAPNSFTPDGDEFNNTWKPVMLGVDKFNFDLIVFNRWGEIVFESHDPLFGWDGTYKGQGTQEGTYIWTAKVKLPDTDEKRTFKGTLNLIK